MTSDEIMVIGKRVLALIGDVDDLVANDIREVPALKDALMTARAELSGAHDKVANYLGRTILREAS